jgi:hypothetical protein
MKRIMQLGIATIKMKSDETMMQHDSKKTKYARNYHVDIVEPLY